MMCCIKNCNNPAGTRKLDSMNGVYELKCNPLQLFSEEKDFVKELKVCDKHYGSLSNRGHKPAKGKSASKSRSDAQLGICQSTPTVLQCYHCHKDIVLSTNSFCKKHKIFVFEKIFSVACNFLDVISDSGKTLLNGDLYMGKPSTYENSEYICTTCSAVFLKALRVEHDYLELKNKFHVQTNINPHCVPKTEEKHQKTPDKGIFASTMEALSDIYKSSDLADLHTEKISVYSLFETVSPKIFPWTISFSNHKTNTITLSLTLPLVSEGLIIQEFKKIDFLLDREITTRDQENFCNFDVKILGNTIEQGHFPLHLFHPNLISEFVTAFLDVINDLPVCPGICDPSIVEAAEKQKNNKSAYTFTLDTKGSIKDGEVFSSCIRSNSCSFLLSSKSYY